MRERERERSSECSYWRFVCVHSQHVQLVQALASNDFTKPIDKVFQMALSEFHATLVSNYSLALQVRVPLQDHELP